MVDFMKLARSPLSPVERALARRLEQAALRAAHDAFPGVRDPRTIAGAFFAEWSTEEIALLAHTRVLLERTLPDATSLENLEGEVSRAVVESLRKRGEVWTAIERGISK